MHSVKLLGYFSPQSSLPLQLLQQLVLIYPLYSGLVHAPLLAQVSQLMFLLRQAASVGVGLVVVLLVVVLVVVTGR